MAWLGIAPRSIRHILITHQDTDHVGAVEADSPGLFSHAKLYVGEVENRYLTGEVRRWVIYHMYKLPQVTINNEKVLLRDGQVLNIDGTAACAANCQTAWRTSRFRRCRKRCKGIHTLPSAARRTTGNTGRRL